MNKKIKIWLAQSFLIITMVLGSFVGTNPKVKKLEKPPIVNNLYSSRVSNLNLQKDIKSLDVSLNIKAQTFSYDLYFKTNKFNNKHVQSYFFCANTNEGNVETWNKIIFNDSDSIVHKKHAFNTASYKQLFDYDEDLLLNLNEKVNFGVEYEKEGIYTGATKSTIELNIFHLTEYFQLKEDSIIMKVNDEKTFAKIDFILNYTTSKIAIDYINLASRTNPNVKQRIYDKNYGYNLIVGANSISFQLKNKVNYQNLYIQLNSKDPMRNNYYYEADIANDLNFVSNKARITWDITSIILLTLIILLIIITLIFVFVTLKMKKSRKDFIEEDDLDYLENNY